VDLSGGSEQRYVEDCQVCCRPNRLTVWIRESDEFGDDEEEEASALIQDDDDVNAFDDNDGLDEATAHVEIEIDSEPAQ
jgi:hypothetical protein